MEEVLSTSALETNGIRWLAEHGMRNRGRVRCQPHQVAVPLRGRSQKREVSKLAAEDGLDPLGKGLLVEAEHTEHRVVVRDRDSALLGGDRALDQVLHPDCAVEERKLGVDV